MARRVFPWLRVVTLAALLATEGYVLWKWGLDALQRWLSVVGGGGVTVACVVWVAHGVTAWRADETATGAAPLNAAAAELVAGVRRTWAREAAHRGLTSPLPIAVRMRLADPLITAHPSQWARSGTTTSPAELLLSGTAADIGDLYSRVATGRLVILGDPGGGKTGAAVLLLLALCGAPQSDGRVPVWFPLASWNPRSVRIEHWMADQLTVIYTTPAAVAQALVQGERILPILDGLDEIAAADRPAAIAGLHSLGPAPLVLTSRTDEYIEVIADGVLAAAAVVEVVPVDPSAAADYLTRSGTADNRRWKPVVAALNTSTPNPCQEALRNPLMLSLARTVYRSPTSDPAELTAYSTAGDVEARLLDALVPSVYGRDFTDTRPEDASRWLTFFADNLDLLGPGAIAWWHLPRCVSRRELRTTVAVAYGLLVAPAAAVVAGTVVGLAKAALGGGLDGFTQGLSYISWYAALYGLACGLVGALTSTMVSAPTRWRRPRRRDLVHALGRAMTFGLPAGFAASLFWGLLLLGFSVARNGSPYAVGGGLHELLDQLSYLLETGDLQAAVTAVGLMVGVATGVAVGVTAAFSHAQLRALTPLSAFKTDRRAGLTAGLVVGTAAGLTAGLVLGVGQSFLSGGTDLLWHVSLGILTVGLPIALGAFLWFAPRRSASWAYGFAVGILARRGLLPHRPLRFLGDAYRRGILRQAGMVYEFRHARLADHLRSANPTEGQ